MSLELIREYLSYDPETGVFTWIKCPNPSGAPQAGSTAGSAAVNGYLTIRFKKRLYYAHRLAWWWIHGEMPEQVDHKNLRKDDNRIVNLRAATNQGNMANREVRNDSVSRYKGVHAHPNGRFYAYIVVDRKKMHLGSFGLSEEAARAYDAAANDNFGEFARLNFPKEVSYGRTS